MVQGVPAKASKGGCPPSFFIQPPSFPHPSLVSYNECQKCFDVLNHHHPFAVGKRYRMGVTPQVAYVAVAWVGMVELILEP